jgi:hypothetical protein
MEATNATNAGNGAKEKRIHHRSPAYPMLNLEQAIEKARIVYNADKRSFTSRAVILKHLGYKDETSGVGNRELSALKQYGLLEEKAGQFGISEGAYAILFLSDASDEKRQQIIEAALTPAIFRELWSKYGADASNETLKDYLIHVKKFNPASVNDVVQNYRDTVALAKPKSLTYTGEDESEQEQGFEIGNYVQWESHGVLQMPEPKRIRGFSEDGDWAFLEGSETGVPVNELIAETPLARREPDALKLPTKPPKSPEQQPAGTISTPVGKDEDRVVFAHVRFDAGIRKEFVASLKKYLDYLETTLT